MRMHEKEGRTVLEARSFVLAALITLGGLYVLGYAAWVFWTTGEVVAWGLAVGVASLLAALPFVFTSRWTLDVPRKLLIWERWSPLGRKAGEVPFRDIQRFVLQSIVGVDGGAAGGMAYRLAVETAGGPVPLTTAYTAMEPHDWEPVLRRLREVVGLEPADTVPESIAAMARAGRTIDAVRLLREVEPNLSLYEAKARVEALSKEG
jgi:hypothetical protein